MMTPTLPQSRALPWTLDTGEATSRAGACAHERSPHGHQHLRRAANKSAAPPATTTVAQQRHRTIHAATDCQEHAPPSALVAATHEQQRLRRTGYAAIAPLAGVSAAWLQRHTANAFTARLAHAATPALTTSTHEQDCPRRAADAPAVTSLAFAAQAWPRQRSAPRACRSPCTCDPQRPRLLLRIPRTRRCVQSLPTDSRKTTPRQRRALPLRLLPARLGWPPVCSGPTDPTHAEASRDQSGSPGAARATASG